MKTIKKSIGLTSILLIGSSGYAQSIPAFSGADGAARTVSGGRGGIVYHVTKLNSAIDDPQRNDPGTIRYGLNNANFTTGVPRTIVFDVGGVFHLGRLTQPNAVNGPWDPNGNGWDAQSRLSIGGTNITIAGQTAPGVGAIFMGGGLKPQGNNNIIRNVSVASGYGMSGWWKPGDAFPSAPGTTADPAGWYPDNVVYDAMDISGTNLMIDHVSTIYATDETISMNEAANNITVQYSNISQAQNFPQWDAEGGGLTGHALGSLLEAGNTTSQAAISFHHNLYAHMKGRVPQMQSVTGSLGAFYDFRNNVFYNWLGTAGTKSGATSLNLVNNFYLAGKGGDSPVGGSTPGWTTTSGGTSVLGTSTTVYRNGNLLDSNKDSDANDGATLSSGGAASALWMGGVATYYGVTDSATGAYDRVLNYVGANWWTRDSTINMPDERIINETRTGTGKIMAWADDPFNSSSTEGTEWRTLLGYRPDPVTGAAPFTRAANFDTDQDGMPDAWEVIHGLSATVADNNGDYDADGYTNLEEYINELAEWPAPKALVFSGTTNARYEQITNWDITWQPSKYDEAQINSGNVTVNSPGQHAKVLRLATASGNTSSLNVSAGWIKIEQELVIGNVTGANGTLNLSGGEIITPKVTRGANGVFNWTGGTLTLNGTGSNFTGTLNVPAAGTLNLLAATALPNNLNVNNAGAMNVAASNTLGNIDGAGTTSVGGSGVVLAARYVRQNALNIGNNAKVAIAANGTNTGVSVLNALTIATGGQLDINDNDLIIRSSGARSVVEQMIRSGQNGVDASGMTNWNGPGLISSTARSRNVSGMVSLYGVGVIRNGDLGPATYSTFGGQTVGMDDVLVKFTYNGDADLSGSITISDYVAIDMAYAGLTLINGWVTGDFDLDGSIAISDYVMIDTAYAFQTGTLSQNFLATRSAMFGPAYVEQMQDVLATLTAVPEPASVALLLLGLPLTMRRRRNRHR